MSIPANPRLPPHGPPRVDPEPDDKVEPAEGKASQVSGVGHIAPRPGDQEEKLQGGKTQDHHRSPEGEYAPNVNDGTGEKGRKGQLDCEDGPGSAHEKNPCIPRKQVDQEGKESCQEAGKQVVEEEFPAPHLPFHLAAEDKEGKHIEYQVAY